METVEQFITRHEGKRNKPYRCSQGFLTIGVGWNMDANPLPKKMRDYLKEHGEITDSMIDDLLRISIGVAVTGCIDLFPDFEKFSDNRRMALIDFVFNLGEHRTSHFINTIAAINTGRWEDAAEGIRNSAYWKQLGGDPLGTNDGKLERPEEVANLLEVG